MALSWACLILARDNSMVYELRLDRFQGPLDKLLELIEARQLEITEINLAAVTDDFLRYLRLLNDAEQTQNGGKNNFGADSHSAREHLRVVADFIAVASRLILIKSKSLVPDIALSEDEEAEIKELEARLKLYRALKPVMKLLAKRWQSGNSEFSRPYFLQTFSMSAGAKLFYPASNISQDTLVASIGKIVEGFRQFASEEETLNEKIISIEEKAKEIIERMRQWGEVSFARLSGTRSRAEVIASFLALLHMAHEQLVLLEQAVHFSDITIRQRTPETS